LAAPSIGNWLSSLDADTTRSRHLIFYQQYTQAFENNAILDLMDMEDLTESEITQLTGAPLGSAKRLVKYAKEDIAKLLNVANKRPRI
jgi:hypothetical protein